MPIFVTSQSSVSWWQLCYPSILLLPPPPHPPFLREPRKKPSAELAFRRFFFKIPISLCSEATSNQSWGLLGLAKGWYCVSCSQRKGCPLAFLFDSLPCQSAGESEVAAAAVAVGCKWETPLFKNLHINPLAGGGKNQKQNRGKNYNYH